MSKDYFISDTHIGHRNIIKYENRPFNSVEEMDEKIINNWNSVVNEEDVVYHLGDFFLTSTDRQIEIMERLKGDIILIRGNHDHQSETKLVERLGFKAVYEDLIIEYDDMKILLSHRPASISYMDKFNIHFNLHGHKHFVEEEVSDRHINLSVENINYIPVDYSYLGIKYGFKKCKFCKWYLNKFSHTELCTGSMYEKKYYCHYDEKG